jgi:putative salt-induced outer membrane protein YdiY
LAGVRYQAGATGYLEVLYHEQVAGMPDQDSQDLKVASVKTLLSGEAKPRNPVFQFVICLRPVLLVLMWLSGRLRRAAAYCGLLAAVVGGLLATCPTSLRAAAEAGLQSPALSQSALPDLSWVPPPDSFDWVQLKSGEWLKGRIRAMQGRELEFDSEELNVLTFDWRDIRQLRSPRWIDVLLVDGERLSGPVIVTPSEIRVGDTEPLSHPRDQLQSLTPGGGLGDYWSGEVSAGLSLRAGNSEQVEYNAQFHVQRRTPATRLSLGYIGNISRVDDRQNANNHRVNSEFDLWLSRSLYLILPFAEYFKDPFQNLQHRMTGGVGVGYDIVDRNDLEWTVTSGPAYQYSIFESVAPGQDQSKGSAALAFGTRFEWDITRRVELILEYRGQLTSREIGETTHHGVVTFSVDITSRFDLDVSLVWDRIGNPKMDADGIRSQPDDYRLVVGLGVDF